MCRLRELQETLNVPAAPAVEGQVLNEGEIAEYIELGQQNARIIDLAANHCRRMRFVQSGGQGVLEETTGLPINSRRIECDVAVGNMSGMRLDHIALDFYANHCPGCQLRTPTGRLPNLETEFHTRQEAAAEADRAEAERVRELSTRRAARVERRRSLRVIADPAAASVLDDIDALDADPGTTPDVEHQSRARLSLTTLARRAPDRFGSNVVEELFDCVETVGLVELLEPLRQLAAKRPEVAGKLVATAVEVLRHRATLEAGRCLTDHPNLLRADSIDEAVVRSAVVLAGAKTFDDHDFSGPSAIIAANDPGPIRVLADMTPDLVRSTLVEILPRPVAKNLILPASVRRRDASDFDRRAAAGAIEHLASTHLDLAAGLIASLAISLDVPPDDSYDTGTLGSAERALGRIFVEDSDRVAPLFEQLGRHASEDLRKGLIGAVRQAVDMADTNYAYRRPQDPVLDDAATTRVIDDAFTFFIARTNGAWGANVTFEAAEAVKLIGRRLGSALQSHVDTTLGAFIELTRHQLAAPPPRLTVSPPDPLAPLEMIGRKHSLFQASMRLLRAVEDAAEADPIAVSATIAALITNERDGDFGVEVVMPLVEALGSIGRRYGVEPGVLQAILPVLHTCLVDSEVGLRSAGLRAWTEIGSRHPVPSTVSDLLPALVTDPYLVVIEAVVDAANRLPWPRRDDATLLGAYAKGLVLHLDPADRLELLLSSLVTLRRHLPDLGELADFEKAALSRIPPLPWYQAAKVVERPWQPDARVTLELAQHWLSLAPRRTFGLRQGDEAEEALNGLLDCGAGLVHVPASDIIGLGARHSPESHYGALEYAEVLLRAERRGDAVELLRAALDRTLDNQAYAPRRALAALALTIAQLQVTLSRLATSGASSDTTLAGVADVSAAVDAVTAAVEFSQTLTGDDKGWFKSFEHAAATRAAIACTLLDIALPAAIGRVLSVPEPSSTTTTDPAAVIARRAQDLRRHAKALRSAQRSGGTATQRGVAVSSQLLDCVAHLLDAEAADLNADLTQAEAHRQAARRRATLVQLDHFRADDPLLVRARALRTTLAASQGPCDLEAVVAKAAGLPAPLLFVRSVDSGRSRGRRWTRPADPKPDGPNVAVALVSIDDKLVTGPAIVDPGLTHTLNLSVQTDPWPSWATRLDAELVSTLTNVELQRPALSWQEHQHTVDSQTFEGTGSLHVRYAVPTAQQAPPVLVRLTWRGTDEDGSPRSQELDVAGHREFRIRPYDPARDAATQHEVFDEHLLAVYEKLAAAGYPHEQLQAFARLLNAISRIGLAMTWSKKYRRGQHVKERDFHDDLHEALLADPTLEGRVERGTAHALGFVDTRHDGITAELKVVRDQPVTPETATKYIGQAAQYAAADGTRLSILVILDVSCKVVPVGTPENYLFVLHPQQHGMTAPQSPSVVVTLVINGNLPVPSSWSRRKTPTRPE